MNVSVYPYREKISMGNIIWPGKFEMRAGRFPRNHPAAPGWQTTDVVVIDGEQCWGQHGKGPGIDAFRLRGYWASCFPEGDGITWRPMKAQSDEQALRDIRECFGWEADWAKSVKIMHASS